MSRTMVLSKWTLLGAVAILVLALVLTFAAVRVASADPPPNLVFNGDFSLGNVGFTSDYTFSPGDIVGEKTYDIVTDPSNSE